MAVVSLSCYLKEHNTTFVGKMGGMLPTRLMVSENLLLAQTSSNSIEAKNPFKARWKNKRIEMQKQNSGFSKDSL